MSAPTIRLRRSSSGDMERECCQCKRWLPMSNEHYYRSMNYCKACARAYGLRAYYRQRAATVGA